ncbi:MAG: glycosyltransferase [Patescibacteria group bacterium]
MEIRKIKLMFAVTKSNWGGAQRYVYDLVTSLPKNQFEITVLLGGSGLLKKKLEAVNFRTISIPTLDRDIDLFKEFVIFFNIWKILMNEKPDILHVNSSKIGGLGSFVGRIIGIKNIFFTVHGWPFFENRFFLFKWLIVFFSWLTVIFSHKTIVISKNDQVIGSRLPFVKDKIFMIHNGIGSIDFKEKDSSRTYLLGEKMANLNSIAFWIAGGTELTFNKNLEMAILGVIEAKRRGFDILYLIIGEGEERGKIEKLIEKYKATDFIRLVGFKENLQQYLKAFDCFLLTSKKEGLPYILLETGLAGIPVIASNVGGIPEIIDDRENGILIEPKNINGIASAIEYLIKNPEIRKIYGEKLQEKVKTQFSKELMLKKTIELYNS